SVHIARVRYRRGLRGRRRNVLRRARAFHRAGAVPFLVVTDDAARGNRRRLGQIPRSGARHGHHRPSARMAALHAELVSGGVRLRGGCANDLAAGRVAVDSREVREEGRCEVTPFLEVKDMKKQYGAIKAVDGVSMSVGPGEIVGVIGPNGSGKTTLFNSILGQIRPTAGKVEFCGEDITGMSPLELSRRGVGRTFQTLQVFTHLSVRDNLIAAAQEFKGTLP